MTYIYIRLLWENPHRENVQHDKGKSRCDAGKTPTSTGSKGSEEHYEQLSIKAGRIILFVCRYTTIIFLIIFYQSLNNQSQEYEWTEIGRKSVCNSAVLQ